MSMTKFLTASVVTMTMMLVSYAYGGEPSEDAKAAVAQAMAAWDRAHAVASTADSKPTNLWDTIPANKTRDDCVCGSNCPCTDNANCGCGMQTAAISIPNNVELVCVCGEDCVPCKNLESALKAAGQNAPRWKIYHSDNAEDDGGYGNIESYPTLIVTKDGKECCRRVGWSQEDTIPALTSWMKSCASLSSPSVKAKHRNEVTTTYLTTTPTTYFMEGAPMLYGDACAGGACAGGSCSNGACMAGSYMGGGCAACGSPMLMGSPMMGGCAGGSCGAPTMGGGFFRRGGRRGGGCASCGS